MPRADRNISLAFNRREAADMFARQFADSGILARQRQGARQAHRPEGWSSRGRRPKSSCVKTRLLRRAWIASEPYFIAME